ncbi:MAG: NADH-quinone oxidoreductase subunit C [Armatimonadota bacterium]|nr:NADH-quinone oxidoreductase subunit C [Armatimonadota bacterium]
MSWDLVEKLKQRFPDIEPFPRQPERLAGEHGPAPTGRPAPRHEAKGPTFHTPGAYIPAERLLEICQVLRGDPEYQMDYCSFVTAVDRPAEGGIDVVYHLFSLATHEGLLLKVRVPREAPRVPSVVSIWLGADWHERETYDLFGVVFDGHPDLRRIMMTDDWQGHPLRKDYVYEEPRWLVELAAQRQREIAGLGLGERA